MELENLEIARHIILIPSKILLKYDMKILLDKLSLLDKGYFYGCYDNKAYHKEDVKMQLVKVVDFKSNYLGVCTKEPYPIESHKLYFELWHDVCLLSRITLLSSFRDIDKMEKIILDFFESDFISYYIKDYQSKHSINEHSYPIILGTYWRTYFGKYMEPFISHKKAILYQYAYCTKEVRDNIVMIQLYKNIKRSGSYVARKNKLKFIKYFNLDVLNNEMRNKCYSIDDSEAVLIKGLDDQKFAIRYYPKLNKKNSSKSYSISIQGGNLILKKYKNTCFVEVNEDFASMEIKNSFIYSKDGKGVEYENTIHISAIMYVCDLCVSGSKKEYAKKRNYKFIDIDENHYLLEKNENNVLEKRHCFEYKDLDVYYEIDINIYENLLSDKEVYKIINEYTKMVKSSQWKSE